MRLEDRQIQVRQHRSMPQIIEVQVETTAQIMPDMPHRRVLQISVQSVPIGWVRTIVDDSATLQQRT